MADVQAYRDGGLSASFAGLSACLENDHRVVGLLNRHWVGDTVVTSQCSWPYDYCDQQPDISGDFFSPPGSQCSGHCEYECDPSQPGSVCSFADPDGAVSATYSPTGEACFSPDTCEEVAPGVMDCRGSVAHGDQDCQKGFGNPCNPATGNKSYSVVDFEADGLTFERTYNSTQERQLRSHLGRGWSHNFGSFITVDGNELKLVNERGHYHPFFDQGNGWFLSGLTDSLIIKDEPLHWLLIRDDERHWFDKNTGLIESIEFVDAAGRNLSIARDNQNRVSEVRNARGRAIVFNYSGDLIESIDTPDGTIAFDYLTTGQSAKTLSSATYPDSFSEEYQYDILADRSLLTQVGSSDGFVKGIYEYDSKGRVTSSRPSDQVAGVALEYFGVDRTVVTTALGDEVEYRTESAQGWFGAVTGSLSGTVDESFTYSDMTYLRPATRTLESQLTEYSYDAKFRETLRREAAGTADQREITTTWNDQHSRRDSVTQGDLKIEYSFDAEGRTIEIRRTDLDTQEVRSSTMEYCVAVDLPAGCPLQGLLRRTTDPKGETTEYVYHPDDSTNGWFLAGDLHQVINPAGHVVEYLEYDTAGRPVRTKDANGVVTTRSYDSRGRLVSVETAAATTQYAYRSDGLVARITQPDGSFLDFEYDSARRLDAIENSLGERIEYDLDAAGNRLEERILNASGALRFQLQQAYDQLGRLQTRTSGIGHQSHHEYDAAGNLVAVTDGLNRTTGHEYDPLNRLKKTLDALGGETSFRYDERDNLIEVTDPEGLSTLYSYNAFDELVELDSPDTGLTTYGYDSAGNRVSQVDARSVTTTYDYDLLGRTTVIGYPDSSVDVSFFYDEDAGVTGCSGSYPIGRLTRMVDASGSTVYCYDARGNLTRKSQMTGSVTLDVTYQYDAADQITSITYPSGQVLTYLRDTTDPSKVVAMLWNGQPVLIDGSYAPFGSIESWSWGNGGSVTRQQGIDGRLTDITGRLNITLEYDAVGNPTAIFPWEPLPAGGDGDADDGSSPPPSPATPPLQQYVYDDLDRLSEVQAGDGSLQRRWTYDPTHNRLSEEVPGTSGGTGDPSDQDEPSEPSGGTSGGVTPYTYASDSHRLLDVDGIPRSYDAAGNTTQIDNQTLIYNATGRLAEVREGALTIATYAYNGRGERVQKATGGPAKTFVYNERGQLLGKYSATGFAEYLWLDDLLVAVFTPAGLHRIETDHLGTPRIATGQYGNTTWRWRIEDNAFGQKPAETISDGDSPGLELNLRFPGQYFDQETGLHYNYFRDYDPGGGRYVESDPIGLGGGVNLYGYAFQSPIRNTDPFGLNPVLGCAAGAAAGPVGCAVGATIGLGIILGIPAIDAARQGAAQRQAMRESSADESDTIEQCPPDDFCYKRWEQEDSRCWQWKGLGMRVVRACQSRAADRRNLCNGNGGKPDPSEPPEYNPFVDFPR